MRSSETYCVVGKKCHEDVIIKNKSVNRGMLNDPGIWGTHLKRREVVMVKSKLLTGPSFMQETDVLHFVLLHCLGYKLKNTWLELSLLQDLKYVKK